MIEETPSRLPKEGLVRMQDLISGPNPVIPVSQRVIHRLMDRGLFPEPKRLGRIKLWNVEDIRKWLATFSSESDRRSHDPQSDVL